MPLNVFRRFFGGLTIEGKTSMSHKYMGGPQGDRLPTVTGMWLEGRPPLQSMNLITALEASFNIVFGLFGLGRNATPSGIIINRHRTDRFQSMTVLNKLNGKALKVEDCSMAASDPGTPWVPLVAGPDDKLSSRHAPRGVSRG